MEVRLLPHAFPRRAHDWNRNTDLLADDDDAPVHGSHIPAAVVTSDPVSGLRILGPHNADRILHRTAEKRDTEAAVEEDQ